eukprot:TRINITY_DN29814_c0_g1_i1.p1 TRINITY_DN29814_c0_g1~~TRINITY_DN29814_c0_g1_i1.p1  ORF type:complete len:137 (-),score=16.87 TRINITY_DN29814_c0_g1_i1:115-525(-)
MVSLLGRICGCQRVSPVDADAGTQESDVETAAPLPSSSDTPTALPGVATEEEQGQSILELDQVQLESHGHGVKVERVRVCEFARGGWYRPIGTSEWIRWRREDAEHDDEDWASSRRGADEGDEHHSPNPQEPENHE